MMLTIPPTYARAQVFQGYTQRHYADAQGAAVPREHGGVCRNGVC
jgi:hypothetical protein